MELVIITLWGYLPSLPMQEYITSHVIFEAPWQGQEKHRSYGEEEGRRRKLVSALAHHVVHGAWACSNTSSSHTHSEQLGEFTVAPLVSVCADFQRSASAMPTSMVAFLLLTKHRKVGGPHQQTLSLAQ